MVDISNDTWTRRGASTVNRQTFMSVISLILLAGLAFSAYTSTFTSTWSVTDNAIGFLGLCFGVIAAASLGTWMTFRTANLLWSIGGYALITGAFGLLLGPIVALYSTASVIRILLMTAALVVVLGVIGAAYPKNLASWGSWLLGALGLLIVGMFFSLFFNIGGATTFLDWAGLIIFGFMTIYDFNRAAHVPHTYKNAVDCAVAIYLDFVNIFIRLLAIMGVKSD